MPKQNPNHQGPAKNRPKFQRQSARCEAYYCRCSKGVFPGTIFASKKQAGSRKVQIGDMVYEIGGVHPFGEPKKMAANKHAFDVRHALAIFTMLSFRNPSDINGMRMIRISFDELCRRCTNGDSGRNAREIPEIVGDLMDTYIRVTNLKTNKSRSFRMFDRIDIEDGLPHRSDGKHYQLSSEFCSLLNSFTELSHLKLDVFTAIRSPLAQAIYLYIPSMAHHHTDQNPFEINLTNLLTQVSAEIPVSMAGRGKLFNQGKNSILKQLDGVETLSGRFCVRLAETADGSDWKLQAWIEK